MGRKINIFVIYSWEDRETKSNLLRHLNPFKENFNLSIWHDDPIIPGQLWKPQIESRYDHTHIFLLLVSDKFMNSQYVRQGEFKTVIDRHKENKSVVIPVIINRSKWHINFNLGDYDFSLNELQVLPEGRRPIKEWNSPDEALRNVAAGINRVISSISENTGREKPEKNKEKQLADAKKEEQLKMSFTGGKAKKLTEKEVHPKAEKKHPAETREEENRLWEEGEAKRRAEVAKRIREAAEASAMRREDEEKKAEAIRIARVEKRIREAADAAVRRRDEDLKRIREAANTSARRRSREENKAVAKRRAKVEKRAREAEALSKKRTEEEKRMKAVAAAKRRAEEENRLRETVAAANKIARQQNSAKERVETKRNAEEEYHSRPVIQANKKVEESQVVKNFGKKKIILAGSIVTVLVIGVLWLYSVFNNGAEEQAPPLPQINAIAIKDSIALAKTKADSPTKEASLSKPAIGDTFGGGIIFSVDINGRTGKIAHLDDAGPMTWINAMKIHEQLGEGWRLPTLEELETMYRTIGQGATNKGEFGNELYWSATDFDEYQARLIRFRNGNTSYHYNKEAPNRTFMVRAIRDFSR